MCILGENQLREIASKHSEFYNYSYLSSGGQQEVYKFEHNSNHYVLKSSLCRLNNESYIVDIVNHPSFSRIKREHDVLSNCTCDYLPKLGPIQFGCLKIDDNTYITYYSEEFIEGKTIRKLIQENYIPNFDELVLLIKNISNAIYYLWSNFKIVHRDIKPENIIYNNSENKFVLLDLGIAYSSELTSLTFPGFIVGTKIYMSPEQLKGKDKRYLDMKSDFFSLGIVLYEFATKIHPFYKNTINETERSILCEDPANPIQYNPEITEGLKKIIYRLLGKEPYSRYRNLKNLIEACNSLQFEKRGIS